MKRRDFITRLSASKDGVVVFDRPLLEVAEDLGLAHEALRLFLPESWTSR
jgi:hypothetical protein